MTQSIAQRVNALSNHKDADELYALLLVMRADLEALRAALNAHVHSGVTAGGANSGAPTTTVPALLTTL